MGKETGIAGEIIVNVAPPFFEVDVLPPFPDAGMSSTDAEDKEAEEDEEDEEEEAGIES